MNHLEETYKSSIFEKYPRLLAYLLLSTLLINFYFLCKLIKIIVAIGCQHACRVLQIFLIVIFHLLLSLFVNLCIFDEVVNFVITRLGHIIAGNAGSAIALYRAIPPARVRDRGSMRISRVNRRAPSASSGQPWACEEVGNNL